MDAASQSIIMNVVFSATIISLLGVWLFSWDITVVLLPDWIRIMIVGGLFLHLIVRSSQIFSERKFHKN